MSTSVSLVLHLELKYCERCGALCLREKGEDALCQACREYLRRLRLLPLRGRRP